MREKNEQIRDIGSILLTNVGMEVSIIVFKSTYWYIFEMAEGVKSMEEALG